MNHYLFINLIIYICNNLFNNIFGAYNIYFHKDMYSGYIFASLCIELGLHFIIYNLIKNTQFKSFHFMVYFYVLVFGFLTCKSFAINFQNNFDNMFICIIIVKLFLALNFYLCYFFNIFRNRSDIVNGGS
jgi:hypothetical protein